MPKTDFAGRTAGKKGGSACFFGPILIELVAQLGQTSNTIKKRFQETEKISTVLSIVTVISTRDYPAPCQNLDAEDFRGCCL
ncbi:hypothetical protein Y032_0020g232 [Ancylostoma ceylanicum]|uniref:Uncharacterized protein n=1 Tax=Ancylostoma ceylanicum TaxID=53326 RepID=A0A016V2A0_9BILA|nr:hypothetical protein Y032_0020g232 [Ancylostoma ceylanicum]